MANGKQDRQFFRLDIAIPVRYRFAKKVAEGKYKVSPPFKALGDNFSGNGAAIKVGKPLPEKTLIYLELYFPFRKEPVLATAEVVRKQEMVYKDKPVALIMVRYLIMEPAAQDQMTGFIISRGRAVGPGAS